MLIVIYPKDSTPIRYLSNGWLSKISPRLKGNRVSAPNEIEPSGWGGGGENKMQPSFLLPSPQSPPTVLPPMHLTQSTCPCVRCMYKKTNLLTWKKTHRPFQKCIQNPFDQNMETSEPSCTSRVPLMYSPFAQKSLCCDGLRECWHTHTHKDGKTAPIILPPPLTWEIIKRLVKVRQW